MRTSRRYRPHGPARPVPASVMMPFPDHWDMAQVIEDEKRHEKKNEPDDAA